MEWKYYNPKPIYAQIVDVIRLRIITGAYEPGSRLPSVRELANEASVNPNTMQKALSELEGSGLIYAVRTSGRFVTEDTDEIAASRSSLASQKVAEFLSQMESLGISREEIIELIKEAKMMERQKDEVRPEEPSEDQMENQPECQARQD